MSAGPAGGPLSTADDLPVVWCETVRPEWCDYNGHLNMAFYVLIFDHATDAFYDSVGFDAAYRAATNCSSFTVETHVNYLAEVGEGAEVRCTTQLLDVDEKRFHYFHRMYAADGGFLSATTEILGVHVDLAARRVVPMPDRLQRAFADVLAAQRGIERPEQQGRVIGIRRK